PGQCGQSGVDRDGHDEGTAGGGEEGDGRGSVAGARGDAAGGGGGDRVPGVGPGGVHYWGSAPRERRPVHVVGAGPSTAARLGSSPYCVASLRRPSLPARASSRDPEHGGSLP